MAAAEAATEAPVVPLRRMERAQPAAPAAAARVMMAGNDDEPHRPVERLALDEREMRDVDDRDEAPSVYGAEASETSRGWFLVGAAMAVGLAAVFLILFSRDQGDTIDLGQEAGKALDLQDTDAVPPAAMVSGPAVRSHSASPPAAGAALTAPSPAGETAPLATVPPTPILPSGSPSGRPAASREAVAPPRPAVREEAPPDARAASLARPGPGIGGWSIQILLACEAATIDRAVRQSGQSSELFVLPVTHEGRACHRVYWGRYADRAGAEYALRHDVPSAYRTGGARPWITRLPS
jgi:hypothetical protein